MRSAYITIFENFVTFLRVLVSSPVKSILRASFFKFKSLEISKYFLNSSFSSFFKISSFLAISLKLVYQAAISLTLWIMSFCSYVAVVRSTFLYCSISLPIFFKLIFWFLDWLISSSIISFFIEPMSTSTKGYSLNSSRFKSTFELKVYKCSNFIYFIAARTDSYVITKSLSKLLVFKRSCNLER